MTAEEGEVCIGKLGQQKVYLHWSDVKDICTNAVAEAYEQASEENKRLKHDVGNLGYKIKNQRHEIDNRLKEIEKLKELLKLAQSSVSYHCALCREYTDGQILLSKISEVLGEE